MPIKPEEQGLSIPQLDSASFGLTGWIRGFVPEHGMFFSRNWQLRPLRRHLNEIMPGSGIRVFQFGPGSGFYTTRDTGQNMQIAAMDIYRYLRTHCRTDEDRYYFAFAAERYRAECEVEAAIDRCRHLTDRCEEFIGYFYLDGRIVSPKTRPRDASPHKVGTLCPA